MMKPRQPNIIKLERSIRWEKKAASREIIIKFQGDFHQDYENIGLRKGLLNYIYIYIYIYTLL